MEDINYQQLTVLVIEDNADAMVQVSGYLQGYFNVATAESVEAALTFCAGQVADCVISGHQVAGTDCLTLINQLRAIPHMRYVPVLVLTEADTADLATQAWHTGADDYLHKATLSEQQLVYAVKAAYLDRRLKEAGDAEREGLVQRNYELEKRHTLMTQYWMGLADAVLTPLAATQEFLALVLDGVGGPTTEKQVRYLGLARGGCASIESTVQRLSRITDLAADPGAMHWDRQDLGALLEHVLDEVRVEGAQMGVAVAIEHEAQPMVFGDRANLSQLLYVLVRRCLWYAAKGGSILVRCGPAADPDRVKVQLTGRTQSGQSAPLDDAMDWQISAALTSAGAADFEVRSDAQAVTYAFELVRYFDQAFDASLAVPATP